MSAHGRPTKPVSHWRRNRVLYLLIAVTLAPILASYFAYYVMPPSGRVNYGTLVEPQRPVPSIPATALDGTAFDLRSLKDKWVFVMVDGGACDEHCQSKLFHMRQQRTMTGKGRDEIERLWLITDREPLSTMLIREHEGTHFVRVDERDLRAFLAAARRTGREPARPHLGDRSARQPDAALAAQSRSEGHERRHRTPDESRLAVDPRRARQGLT